MHFELEDVYNFGSDYDRTLMAWYHRFDAAWGKLQGTKPEYDDRFYRMWGCYLLSCAGGFRACSIQLWQWVLSPNGVPGGYRRPAVSGVALRPRSQNILASRPSYTKHVSRLWKNLLKNWTTGGQTGAS